ncbi:ACT domain-containing protein [Massilia endophytica]|uniref:hypothetical protein n=1 Tax=Massilia endophytica TaxID=2899220 RepID=UPI001E64FBF6|nr:hypothetical protein [Massilia endophytica]UGQ48667.1 hypothetical protein LSQ66_09465 [Massilia endophytica]
MDDFQRNFRLRVEPQAATDALEMVLAIVRRGGLALRSLRMEPGRHGVVVDLSLAAAEEDALQLCRMRLCNVIGILKIRETGRYAPT